MTDSMAELNEKIDAFVEELLDESIPKRAIAAALENKSHELYDEDEEKFDI